MRQKVFLRFCTADKAVAETLRENLEKRGFQVWAPQIDTSSAIRWNEQIAKAIDEAEVALLVFSSRLGLSPQLERELRRACANGARLVIVSVEEAPLPNGLRDLVKDRDWLAAWDPPFEAHLDRIAEAVAPVAAPVDAAKWSGEHLEEIHEEIYLLDPPDVSARKTGGEDSVNGPKSIWRAIDIGAAGVALLLIFALLYAALAHFTSSPSSPAPSAVTGPSAERLVRQQSGDVLSPTRPASQDGEAPRLETSSRLEQQARDMNPDQSKQADATADPSPRRLASQIEAGRSVDAPAPSSSQSIKECDKLAASPEDPDRATDFAGVEFSSIDPDRAIAACSAAASSYPNERRIAFQLGRALYAARRYDEARRVLEGAAQAGSVSAANSLGIIYLNGTGLLKKDEAKAATYYDFAARAGDVRAMTNLAKMRVLGIGVPRDGAKGMELYRRAAAGGSVAAKYELGLMYLEGKVAPRDPAKAKKLLEEAARSGSAAARAALQKNAPAKTPNSMN
jgi:TPR repeat protein